LDWIFSVILVAMKPGWITLQRIPGIAGWEPGAW
jgi:hypothetical protein